MTRYKTAGNASFSLSGPAVTHRIEGEQSRLPPGLYKLRESVSTKAALAEAVQSSLPAAAYARRQIGMALNYAADCGFRAALGDAQPGAAG